jgi:broad specificity phosphatase PhoE
MRLLLIRHADPGEEARGRCYGSLDVGLSGRGREQARELAGALAGTRLDAVYASPRRRALETAVALLPEPIVDERLRELDFGEFEGRTYEEIAESHPDVYRRWMETPTEVRFPGGESYAELRSRALEAAAELRAGHSGETVAAVTHGGVVRAIVADALGMPDAAIFRLGQDYGAVTALDWIDGVPVLRLLNGPASAL